MRGVCCTTYGFKSHLPHQKPSDEDGFFVLLPPPLPDSFTIFSFSVLAARIFTQFPIKQKTMPKRFRSGIILFAQYYASFFPFASSLTISAAKMTTTPSAMFGDSRPPSSRQENAAPNTDSSERMIDAWDAGAML